MEVLTVKAALLWTVVVIVFCPRPVSNIWLHFVRVEVSLTEILAWYPWR